MNPRSPRERKPGTILRELRASIGTLHVLGGWGDTKPHADKCYSLLRELRRSTKRRS